MAVLAVFRSDGDGGRTFPPLLAVIGLVTQDETLMGSGG